MKHVLVAAWIILAANTPIPTACRVPGHPSAVCFWVDPAAKECSEDGGKSWWPSRHRFGNKTDSVCYEADKNWWPLLMLRVTP